MYQVFAIGAKERCDQIQDEDHEKRADEDEAHITSQLRLLGGRLVQREMFERRQ